MQKELFARLFGRISPLLVASAYIPWLIFLYLVVKNHVITLSYNDQDIIQKFIEWFGTAYSLFLALVLGYVWQQFDNLDREFDLEADALAALHQTASYISTIISTEPPPGWNEEKKGKLLGYINEIEDHIVAYVKHVIKHYQSEYSNTQQRETGEKLLDSVGKTISLITFEKSTPDTLVTELFSKLNEAMDTRGDRLAHSKQRMPSAVRLVALVSSIVWLIPFLGLIIVDAYVFALLVGGAGFVIVMVLAIVDDLDNPFDGAWKVNIDSWYQFLEKLEPTLVFIYNIKDTLYEREIKPIIGKLFKRKVCHLRNLTYNWIFETSDWKGLNTRIQEDGNIVTKELLSDQYPKDICYSKFGVAELPIIIYRSKDTFHLLLGSEEIDNCDNLANLNEAIKQKLSKLKISYAVN